MHKVHVYNYLMWKLTRLFASTFGRQIIPVLPLTSSVYNWYQLWNPLYLLEAGNLFPAIGTSINTQVDWQEGMYLGLHNFSVLAQFFRERELNKTQAEFLDGEPWERPWNNIFEKLTHQQKHV